MEPVNHIIQGAPCWSIKSDLVELFVTQRGGHIAPVRFYLDENNVATPYSMPPWEPSEVEEFPEILQILRGDFFCFPFGVTEGIGKPHGPTANEPWELVHLELDQAKLRMDLQELGGGYIEKTIQLHEGHRVIYQEHVICGVEGNYNYGHHPILEFPVDVECPVRVSPFSLGGTHPTDSGNPEIGEYSSLKPNVTFVDMDAVELARGGMTSLSAYPAREGFEDIAMVSASQREGLAWTAVTFPGYVWVTIRNVTDFPSTLFWMSNGGRHMKPWSSHHRRRMGVEDICSHYHDGAHISSQDLLKDYDIPTSKVFRKDQTVALRHAQFVCPVEGQPGLKEITFGADHESVDLQFEDGQISRSLLKWKWLLHEELG